VSAVAEVETIPRPKVTGLPVCVALPTSEIGRFMMFTISLAATLQPPGSRIHAAASASVTENLNAIIREMLPTEATC